MSESLSSEVNRIIGSILENPTHIINWEKKEQSLKKSAELYESHMRYYSEDFIFSPDEYIMTYVDFPYRGAPLTDENAVFRAAQSRAHSHEFFELLYVYKGKCFNLFGSERNILKEGSVLIFDTRARHGVYVPDGSIIVNILVRNSVFTSKIQGMLQGNSVFLDFFINSIYSDRDTPAYMRFHAEKGSPAEMFIFSIIKEYSLKNPCFQEQMTLLFSSLLLELSRLYESSPSRQRTSAEFNTAKIISYIDQNLATVSLKELSARFSFSDSQISRFISSYTKTSFSSYITNLRLKKAASLLSDTRLSIEAIAESVGYASRFSFEKRFKANYGTTPASYRKKYNK